VIKIRKNKINFIIYFFADGLSFLVGIKLLDAVFVPISIFILVGVICALIFAITK